MKETILLGLPNEGEYSFELALVKKWDISKPNVIGDTVFFEADGSHFSVDKQNFDKIMKEKDAVEEAGKMMRTPMGELPELAREYLSFLAARVGMCMEVCLTAYAVYNQMVLKMKCDDDLYIMTQPEDIEWWADKGYTNE